MQKIVDAVLYYGRAINNKLMVALSTIVSQQEAAIEDTSAAVEQLLDYVVTYPHDVITYRASDMILAAHSDASYLNKRLSRSHAGSHMFLSENNPSPTFNGPVLIIATIIKFFISLAAESDLVALSITEKEMIPLPQTLIDMRWTQPPSPIQTDNSTSVGVVNKTIFSRRIS